MTQRRFAYGLGAAGIVALLTVAMTGCSTILSSQDPTVSATTAGSNTSAIQDYTVAENLRTTGRCAQAIPLYLRALTKNSAFVFAYQRMGDCDQTVGSLDAAIQAYDKAITLDPNNFDLYYERAGAEINNGNRGAAVTDLYQALASAPPQTSSYLTIAQRFDSFQDFADEIQVFDKAMALAPDDTKLYVQQAALYLQNDESRRAFDDYTRALQVTTNPALQATLYAGIADVYAAQERYDDAYKAGDKAISLQQGSAALYLRAGDIHQAAADYPKALMLYNKALELTTVPVTLESVHEAKGDTYVKTGQIQLALSEYKQASRFIFANPDTQAHLAGKIADIADAYSSQQDFAAAIQASGAAIAVQPNNPSLYRRAGIILATARHYTASLSRYNQALQHATTPSDIEQIHDAKGDAYAKLGQTSNARGEYNQAKRLTQDPDVLAALDNKINALPTGSTK